MGLLLGVLAPAHGDEGFNVKLPLAGVKSTSGLFLTFDCTWPDGYGYLPIRATVSSSAPSTANRRIALEISSRYFGERRPVLVTDAVELPAGATIATKVIPFPRCSNNVMLSLDVYENGRYLKELSFSIRPFKTRFSGANNAPATLFVTAAQIDVSKFDFLTNASVTYNYGQTPPATPGQLPAIGPAQVTSFAALPAADLFEGWINYSGLDVIFLARSDLENLANTRPKVVTALGEWARAGGNLCIYDVGNQWQGLAVVEERLQLAVTADDAAKPLRGWSAPDPALYLSPLQQPGGAIVVTETSEDDAAAAALRLKKRKKPVPAASFAYREIGLGMVVAMQDDKPFPGDAPEWRWLFNTIGPNRWNWEFRHGLSMNNGNPGFDDFIIADVGLPPVKAYRVLITLFVVGIGPLNYWLLRRKGRLHLLLFTVPAAAIVVSLSLVAYAVIADGFDAYLRARSFTQLDQRRDEAVTMAMLSYYTGMAPADGLHFSERTALYPVFRDSTHQGSVQSVRALAWTPEQHLVRGWVPSRTPTQYETVRPHASQRELRIAESSEPKGCTIENRLGAKIELLMLRSAAGDLYFGRDIPVDGRAALEVLDDDAKAENASLEMFNRRNSGAGGSPAAVVTPAARLLFGPTGRNNRNFGNAYAVNGSGLLDGMLALTFQEIGSQLPDKRTYTAIVERPPDVEVGMDGLVERQSLHVIRGTW
ncbi:MAG: hypothetical protein WD845_11610 [Pirellulales bacterium]